MSRKNILNARYLGLCAVTISIMAGSAASRPAPSPDFLPCQDPSKTYTDKLKAAHIAYEVHDDAEGGGKTYIVPNIDYATAQKVGVLVGMGTYDSETGKMTTFAAGQVYDLAWHVSAPEETGTSTVDNITHQCSYKITLPSPIKCHLAGGQVC
jgi:hypothetical protein